MLGQGRGAGQGDFATVDEPAIYLAGLDGIAYTGSVIHAPNFGKTWP